ncbi:MAG: acyl carrier protein [Alphaproteobacteria bacterium]|nr:acyl carrier protein [Alphaproteobacteria bacterium]
MITCEDIVSALKNKITNASVDLTTVKYDQPLRLQGIDSLDVSLLLFALEEKYSISIPTSKIGELLSIDDFCSYINDALKSQAS